MSTKQTTTTIAIEDAKQAERLVAGLWKTAALLADPGSKEGSNCRVNAVRAAVASGDKEFAKALVDQFLSKGANNELRVRFQLLLGSDEDSDIQHHR